MLAAALMANGVSFWLLDKLTRCRATVAPRAAYSITSSARASSVAGTMRSPMKLRRFIGLPNAEGQLG
jgi:hypothetical protein